MHRPPSTFQADLEKFKGFVAGCRLDELHGKIGVPVLGRMGSSKSTTIAIQQGAIKQLDVTEDGRNTFKTIKSDAFCPQTSDGFQSKTLNIGCYQSNDITYLDTAGLNENRGPNEALWTTWSTSMMFALLAGMRALLVCIDYQDFSSRAEAVRQLAECLSHIVGGGESSQPLYKSMVFVFSNPWRVGGRQKETISQVLAVTKRVKTEEHSKLLSLLGDFVRDYRKSVIRAAICVSTDAMAAPETHAKTLEAAVDWKQVPQHLVEDYDRRVGTIRLLSAIEDAGSEGCFLSWPDGPTESKLQRREIDKMIGRAPGVSKDQLRDVVRSRATHGLLVCQTLAMMTTAPSPVLGCGRSYGDTLAKKAEVLRELRDQFTDKQHAHLLQLVESNWECARDHLTRKKQEAKDALEADIGKHEQEKRDLQRSMKVMPLHVEQIRVARRLSWNPLSWFGMNSATGQWEFRSDFFLNYELAGRDFEKTEHCCWPSEGVLELGFESSCGQDLSVDVKVMLHEKDLPATHERVEALARVIDDTKAKLEEVEAETMRLRFAKGKRELVDFVFEKNRALWDLLRATSELLQREPGCDELSPGARGGRSEGATMDALARLLSLLQGASDGLPGDLADGPRQSIADFVSFHAEVLTLTKDLEGHELARENMGSVRSPSSSPVHEDEEPVSSWRYQGRLALEKAQGVVSSSGAATSTVVWTFTMVWPFLVDHSLAIGAMLVVLSFHVPLGALLQCVAAGIMAEAARRMLGVVGASMLDVTGGVDRNLRQLRQDLNHHVHEATSRADRAVQEAAARVADQTSVNVDLQAGGPGPVGGILGVVKGVVGMAKFLV